MWLDWVIFWILVNTTVNNCEEGFITFTLSSLSHMWYSDRASADLTTTMQLILYIKRHLQDWSCLRHMITCVWGLCLDRSYLTYTTISSYPIALSCTLIFVETEQRLPSAENGAWLDYLSVVNEVCLKNKPRGASIPRTSLVHHKKKSGHIIITRVLFLTVLQLDVRHQSLQQEPREPLWTLTENGILPAAILHVLCPFSDSKLDRKHIFKCCELEANKPNKG